MRKIARDLGVEAMSLYNHVDSKGDLLDGMVEIVAGKFESPSITINWRTAMRRRAETAHEVLLRHPWAIQLLISRANIGPAMLGYVDATLGCLRNAGFSPEIADHAWNAIDSHIYGFTIQELNFPFDASEYSEAAASHIDRIPIDQYPHLNELTAHVMHGRYDGIHDFAFALEFILDGLARLRDGV